MRPLLAASLLVFHAVAAVGQASATKEFPADAVALSSDALKEALTGKVYSLNWVGANPWRLDFRGNGYVYFNSGASNASGTWQAEEGKVCTNVGNFGANCNEVKQSGGLLYYKRQSGEVIPMTVR